MTSSTNGNAGETFQSFCVAIYQNIGWGGQYNVSEFLPAQTNGQINWAGYKLADLDGVYLFDLWSHNAIVQNQADAGAVQVALWLSEGYIERDITGEGGYSSTDYNNALSTIETLLNYTGTDTPDEFAAYLATNGANSLLPANYTATDVSAIELTNGVGGSAAQDQVILTAPNIIPNGSSDSVPEPVTLAIWGVGAGLAGAAALRRRKQPRGRWSQESRQAIFHVIEGKR